MKQTLFFALIFVLLSCNNEAKKEDTGTDTSISDTTKGYQPDTIAPSPPPVDTEKWKIDNAVANRMITYVRGCSSNCKNQKKITDSNKIVHAALVAKYPPPAQVIPVDARYRDNWEADNYCVVRGFSTSPNGRCKVKKFKTIIYKVLIPTTQPSAQPAFTEMFYDIVTICPPPEGSTPADCGFPFVPDSTKKKK